MSNGMLNNEITRTFHRVLQKYLGDRKICFDYLGLEDCDYQAEYFARCLLAFQLITDCLVSKDFIRDILVEIHQALSTRPKTELSPIHEELVHQICLLLMVYEDLTLSDEVRKFLRSSSEEAGGVIPSKFELTLCTNTFGTQPQLNEDELREIDNFVFCLRAEPEQSLNKIKRRIQECYLPPRGIQILDLLIA